MSGSGTGTVATGTTTTGPSWTYSNWITYGCGTSARLTALRNHIQEVSDFISTGKYQVGDQAVDKDSLQTYLNSLFRYEQREGQLTSVATGTGASQFTRGRHIL